MYTNIHVVIISETICMVVFLPADHTWLPAIHSVHTMPFALVASPSNVQIRGFQQTTGEAMCKI